MDENTLKQSFAARLKMLREEKNLSQSELANCLGASRGSISFYENADRVAGIDFIAKAAEFFGCSADYLLGGAYRNRETERHAIADFEFLSGKLKNMHVGKREILYKLIKDVCRGYASLTFGYRDCESLYLEKLAETAAILADQCANMDAVAQGIWMNLVDRETAARLITETERYANAGGKELSQLLDELMDALQAALVVKLEVFSTGKPNNGMEESAVENLRQVVDEAKKLADTR